MGSPTLNHIHDDNMDMQEKQRLVQQYVERQRAYLPTYTAENLKEHPGTPSKAIIRSDEFGFDTPILRPRVSVKKTPVQAGPSKSRTHGDELGPSLAPRREALSEGQKYKMKPKRKKASTPITDTDNERAARLADRRERKRKKRAIVDPPQQHDDVTPKNGRANGQKAKKPAALALLYGFSATNVTKDRLTLKPAPSLGVFSKGKASAKKKVTAAKKSTSRNDVFSESAFLNKGGEHAADHSETDDDSSVSSVPDRPVAKATKDTKKGRRKCAEIPATNIPQTSTRTTAESEVWEIELQSKLPSSACNVSSEPEAKESAPVALDLHGAEWSASINVTTGGRRNKTGTPSMTVSRSLSRGHSVVRSSPVATSNLRHEHCLARPADVSSIHPSHSASQVGRRAADTQPPDQRLAISKYFPEPKAVLVEKHPEQTSISNGGIDEPDYQDPKDAALTVQTISGIASPMNSLIAQPMVQFQTPYDIVPLEFSSDVSPYDDCYARADVPWERGPDVGFESSIVDSQVDRSLAYLHSPEGATWDWFRPASLADGEEDFQGPEYEDVGSCFLEPQDAGEAGHIAAYENEESDCYSEEREVPGFLEGRALLLGVMEDERHGLARAEMEVAIRLRDHWRPMRY